MTIERLESLERAKDDPTCSTDEFVERCTQLAYAQQAAFPHLLAVAKAAKAVRAEWTNKHVVRCQLDLKIVELIQTINALEAQ